MRVLIVEDEWFIAALIERSLVDAGYEVVGLAGNVKRALHLIDHSGCDVVVLDANLAGISAEPIAEVLNRRGTPFVVVSGYEVAHRSGLLGRAPALDKPVETWRLIQQLQQLSSR